MLADLAMLSVVLQESIDEEPEEGSSPALAAPSSWRRRGAAASPSPAATCPGSPSTPVKQATPAHSPRLTKSPMVAGGQQAGDELLSHDELWQQHHKERQQHQQEWQQTLQLTRAVHAAIAAKSGKGADGQQQPPLPPALPLPPQQQPDSGAVSSATSPAGTPPVHSARSSAERTAGPAQASSGSRLSSSVCSLEELLQQQTPPRLQLPQQSGTDIRTSSGSLGALVRSFRLQFEQSKQKSDAGQATPPLPPKQQPQEQQQQQQEVPDGNSSDDAAAATVGQHLEAEQTTKQGTAEAEGVVIATSSAPAAAPAAAAADDEGAAGAAYSCPEQAAAAAAPAAEASTPITAAADALGEEGSGLSSQQQQQQQPGGPTWGVDDYEEEFQQLSQQLQELVTANSALKATLQQRDNALEQRCHELACCESMLQEVHERLAASEAAAADAAAQHCEAMWAKGQAAGLMEVNEALQVQLEQQGQELEQLKAALERFMATEAAPEEAQAYAAASAALEQEASADGSSSSSSMDQGVSAAADNVQAGCVLAAVGPAQHQLPLQVGGAAPEQPPAETHGADGGESGAINEAAAQQVMLVAVEAAAAPAAVANALNAGQDQPTPVSMPAADSGVLEAATPAASAATAATAAAAAADSTARKQPQAVMSPAAATAAASTARQGHGSSSVSKQLRRHTSQLSAQPSNMRVAAAQAILLRYHIEAVGLKLEKKKCEAKKQQCEAKLAQLSRQHAQLKQRHQAQQQHGEQLLRHQRHREQQEATSSTPRKQLLHRVSSSSTSGDAGEAGSVRAATTAAKLRPGLYSYSLRSPLEASPVGSFAARLASEEGSAAVAGGAAAAAQPLRKGDAESAAVPDVASAMLTTTAAAAVCPHQAESRADTTAASPAVAAAGQERTADSSATAAGSAGQHAASESAGGEEAEQLHGRCGVMAAGDSAQRARCSSDGVSASTASSSAQHTAAAAGLQVSCTASCDEGDAQSGCSSHCSDSSSASQGCQDMLFDLLQQLQALAQESHEASNFTAASASTLTGNAAAAAAGDATAAAAAAAGDGAKACWPLSVAAEVQTRLQVKSACHLEMTRGLLYAGDALMTLQSELTAEKEHSELPQQEPEDGESPPLARSLLSKFEGAGRELRAAAAATHDAAEPVVEAVGGGAPAGMPAGGVQQQPEQRLQVLERLEQQQQRILQALATQPAAGGVAASDAPGAGRASSSSHQQEASALPGDLAALQEGQQELLQQLREAKVALQQDKVLQQQQQHAAPAGRQQGKLLDVWTVRTKPRALSCSLRPRLTMAWIHRELSQLPVQLLTWVLLLQAPMQQLVQLARGLSQSYTKVPAAWQAA
ncbi:hypothetical protein COO60DRAFT_1052252 [Scenedesmus sp. NREL 46B-D3]|nr:hypothetical protein COO60DRAFT_1052252 [Scenedesmus sp. NREL 46B-D3]